MNEKATRADKIVMIACAVPMTLVAILLAIILAGLCIHGVRNQFRDDGLGLLVIGSLAFFSAYISWRLWWGSRCSSGVTLMPTWFLQTFGVFILIGIAYTGYYNPRYWLLAVGVLVAYGVITLPKSLAETRRRNGRGS